MGLTGNSIALGADGASIMSGCNEGVRSKLKRRYPWVIYIHCSAHRLNLIVVTYLKYISVAKGLFDAYQSLHNVHIVARNREIFEETQKEVYLKESIVSAKSLCETRRSYRFLSIDTIYRKLKAILISLQKYLQRIPAMQKWQSANIIKFYLVNSLYPSSFCMKSLVSTYVCKKRTWITIVSEIHAIRQQLERINTGEIIERASIKCMEVEMTLNYEDPLQALRSDELFDPK